MSQLILYKGFEPAAPNRDQVSIFIGNDGITYSKDEFGNVIKLSNDDAFAIANHIAQPDPHPQYVLKTQVEKVEYITLSNIQILNKSINLLHEPVIPENVKVDLKNGGGPLFLNEDFIITGNVISWATTDLKNLLSEGDKLRVVYTYS